MAKFLVVVDIRHADNPAEEATEWVVKVNAPSRSDFSKKNLALIESHVGDSLGAGWVTCGSRVLKKNEPRGSVEDELTLKKGKLSNG